MNFPFGLTEKDLRSERGKDRGLLLPRFEAMDLASAPCRAGDEDEGAEPLGPASFEGEVVALVPCDVLFPADLVLLRDPWRLAGAQGVRGEIEEGELYYAVNKVTDDAEFRLDASDPERPLWDELSAVFNLNGFTLSVGLKIIL